MKVYRFVQPPLRRMRERWEALLDPRGMVSAEYAVGILAAVAFALLLLSVMQSDAVRAALAGIVSNALSVRG